MGRDKAEKDRRAAALAYEKLAETARRAAEREVKRFEESVKSLMQSAKKDAAARATGRNP